MFDPASAAFDSLQLGYGCYRALLFAAAASNPARLLERAEPNLGGSLLYAGELDAHGRAMVIAGNVAGCANLAATADPKAQKEAIREGVVDFLVTSLDEALRILKNEIRKREAVAVCVADAHAAIEQEMLERGVLPDFVFAGLPAIKRDIPRFGNGSREIQVSMPDAGLAMLRWQVSKAPARWMPKLDAIAAECLAADAPARRWIRLSPRYCGRDAQGQRALYIDSQAARQIVNQFGAAVRNGDVVAEVSGVLIVDGETIVYHQKPGENA